MAADSDDGFSLGLDEPAQPQSASPYRVLARKYRPQSFAELIGQDAMVQTLANAIKRDRLAHAFLLTGVRGVGKTSTARLIAKALNCIGPDGKGGPTIHPCGVCEPCVAIAEGRHIDVVEMDAASHTGIDDVREIIEAVRYAAVSARYKIYLIDEVHMLSKQAFNGLLKTLEEPPAHVKFLFATTEVGRMPLTVLSRCQRFDLRRIPAEQLVQHFAMVAEKEAVDAEPEALAVIARAAEGSARDGLSILDQAIAHGGSKVTAEQVRAMIGLSDRSAVRDLFALLLSGDALGALASVREQYALGVEPSALLRSLLECVHGITLAKVGGPPDPAQSAEERDAYGDWASRLGYATIHRLWQLLLKGLSEVHTSPRPLEAAEMALLRVIHASDLPDPGVLAERLANGDVVASPRSGDAPAPRSEREQGSLPATFPALIDLLAAGGKQHLAQQLHDYAGLVRYAPPELVIRPSKPLAGEFSRDLAAALKGLTGTQWKVSSSDAEAQPSLLDQEKAEAERLRQAVLDSPMVRAAFEAFPEAELIGYTADEQRNG
jgi:DNA polymerase-3 subunit gamma/tau